MDTRPCAHRSLPVPFVLANLSAPVLIGHRGMGISHRNPANPYTENTRASFLAAHAAGADWVELDVLPSADGDLMLHHDHFLVAFNGDTRPIWTVGTDELLDLGIERLDGLCDSLPPALGLYLELKVSPGDIDPRHGPPSARRLLDWMAAHSSHRPMIAASFDPYVCLDLHAAGVPTAWITDGEQHLFATATAAAKAGLPLLVVRGPALDAPLHEVQVAQQMMRDHGVTVWTWGPSLERLAYYQSLGVTGFCVDSLSDATHALRTTPPVP